MAILTELGRFAYEHCPVVAAVNIVAYQAVFSDRLMFEPVGSSLFCVAGETKLVDRVCLYHFFAKTTVWIMAVSAFHFAFPERVMRLPV